MINIFSFQLINCLLENFIVSYKCIDSLFIFLPQILQSDQVIYLINLINCVAVYCLTSLFKVICKVEEGADQYVTYDISGKVTAVYSDANKTIKKVEYLYDDRGFRLAKMVYPQGGSGEARTTWYIRDASGSVLSIYEQEGAPSESNNNPLVQTEVPIYGSGKVGTYYPSQDGSINYEITDHLGNVRALIRENIVTYTATMEDSGEEELSNPRVQELGYFEHIAETVVDNIHMNASKPIPGVVDVPDKAAQLHWIDGMSGMSASERSMGPAIALRVKAGDTLRAEVWSRYEIKTTYTSIPVATFASLVAGVYTGAAGLEGISAAQSGQTFSNALAGIFTSSDDDRPFAHLNYVLLNSSLQTIGSHSVQVPEEAGFEAGEESLYDPVLLSLPEPVIATEDGYIYIWVSNASENTLVWFDDLKVTHSSAVFVAQATDYGVWGDILREQKTDESIYRFAYQGQFSERDLETGWNHFELREYDPLIGRWTAIDPRKQYWSPYIGVGNNPVNNVDPTGGEGGPARAKGAPSFKYETAVMSTVGEVLPEFTAMPDNPTPWQVGWEWMTGAQPRERYFTSGDMFTEMLKQHSHVEDTRNTIRESIYFWNGKNDIQGENPYDLGGIQGVGKYLKDYSTLLTAGKTGNIAVTYLGSYNLVYKVTSIDVENRVATVHFTVVNASTIQSALRPPVLGYTEWWRNNVGNKLNEAFSSGPLSTTKQTFEWTEKVKY